MVDFVIHTNECTDVWLQIHISVVTLDLHQWLYSVILTSYWSLHLLLSSRMWQLLQWTLAAWSLY